MPAARYLAGRPTSPNSFYEAKYKDPLGIVFDLTHTGWAGAVKDVVREDPDRADAGREVATGRRHRRRAGRALPVAARWRRPACRSA